MGENSTPEEHAAPKRARIPGWVLPLAGLAIACAGMLIAWLNRNTHIGWFAYAPLSNQTFSGNGMAFLSPGTQAGLGIAVAGLLLLAFWAGYIIGRKTSRREQ